MKQLEVTSIIGVCQLICSPETYNDIIALLFRNSVHHQKCLENGVC